MLSIAGTIAIITCWIFATWLILINRPAAGIDTAQALATTNALRAIAWLILGASIKWVTG